MNRNLLILAYLKQQWLPYLQENPDALSETYYRVLKLFPRQNPSSLRGLFGKDNRLQAAASVNFEVSPVYINLLLTAPWRGKGAGSRLLVRVVREALLAHSNGVILSAEPEAIAFYLKHGFQITGKPLKPWHTTNMKLDKTAARTLVRDLR
jgi:GNAT superfamily N-acetyltransferase